MTNAPSVSTAVMRAEHVPLVVAIHMKVLGDTFNASVGVNYLQALYQNVIACPVGIGFLAMQDAHIIGFVTGTTHLPTLQRQLALRLRARDRFALLRQLVLPRHLMHFLTTLIVNQPIQRHGETINAYLLTLGVDPDVSGQGAGRLLVRTLLDEFQRRGTSQLCLNTVARNSRSRRFYEAIGFQLHSIKMGNAIYLYHVPATDESK